MPHTYSNLLVHVIFSTQGRRSAIPPEIQSDLFAYMGGIVRGLRGRALAIGGSNDHVHVLMRLPQDQSVADVVRVVKTNSSRWIHEKWAERAAFSWQTSYGVFSVSESGAEAVIKYISEQPMHHRHRSFQEEFVAFLERNRIRRAVYLGIILCRPAGAHPAELLLSHGSRRGLHSYVRFAD